MSASSSGFTATTTPQLVAQVTQGASVVVQNIGTHVVAVGFGDSVTATNGLNLASGTPGGVITLGPFIEVTEIYVVAASSTSKVIVAVLN